MFCFGKGAKFAKKTIRKAFRDEVAAREMWCEAGGGGEGAGIDEIIGYCCLVPAISGILSSRTARNRRGDFDCAAFPGPVGGREAAPAHFNVVGVSMLGATLRDNEEVTRAIARDPETMHGLPVFRGTRVPVQTLFEYLEGGDTFEDFLEGFPTVSRALAAEALAEAKQLLLGRAS